MRNDAKNTATNIAKNHNIVVATTAQKTPKAPIKLFSSAIIPAFLSGGTWSLYLARRVGYKIRKIQDGIFTDYRAGPFTLSVLDRSGLRGPNAICPRKEG